MLVALIFAAALVALLTAFVLQIVGSRGDEPSSWKKTGILGVFFLGALFLYTSSGYGEYYPRYLFSLFPMVSALFGWWLASHSQRYPAVAAAIAVPLLLQNAIGNFKVDPFYFSQPMHNIHSGVFLPENNKKLFEVLEEEGIDRLHCDYWIAFVVALESGEEVICDSNGDRWPPYREAFRQSPRPGYLFHNHDWNIHQHSEFFEGSLDYRQRNVSAYTLFVPNRDFIPRSKWKVTSNINPSPLEHAIDGDFSESSVWAVPVETEEAWLEIDLGEVTQIDRVVVVRGWVFGADVSGEGLANGQLLLSTDGVNWEEQGTWVKDPTDHIDAFRFEPREARYLRIVHRPTEIPCVWSVFDIFVQ
jgi:hypothetical protein